MVFRRKVHQRIQWLVSGATNTVFTGKVAHVLEDLVVEQKDKKYLFLKCFMFSFFPLRGSFNGFLNFMGHLSFQCDKLLEDEKRIRSLQKEHYDVTVLDAFNPCTFILAHRLGICCSLISSCHHYGLFSFNPQYSHPIIFFVFSHTN